MAASSRSAADGAGGVGDSPVLWSGEKKVGGLFGNMVEYS